MKLISICVLVVICSTSYAFNIDDTADGITSLSSPVGPSENPAFFGYDVTVTPDGSLKIGAPKTVNADDPAEQSSPSYPRARGDLLACPLSFDDSPPLPCNSSTPPGTVPGDSFGLSLNVAPDETITACSPTKQQTCRLVYNNPGYCYQKKGGSDVWTPDPKTAAEACNLRFLDMIFLLDASGSIDNNEFDTVKNWTKTVASRFRISDQSTRIGVVRFSWFNPSKPLNDQDFINTEIALGNITNRQDFDRAVDAIEPTRLQTYTSHALNKTVFDFMSSDGFNDSNTAKVLILLTDGESTDDEYLMSSAKYVRSLGITTYAVGVGDAVRDELRIVATGTNTDDRVYYVSDFNFLDTVTNELQTSILNSALEGTQANSNQTDFDLEYAQYGFSIQSSRRPLDGKSKYFASPPIQLDAVRRLLMDGGALSQDGSPVHFHLLAHSSESEDRRSFPGLRNCQPGS